MTSVGGCLTLIANVIKPSKSLQNAQEAAKGVPCCHSGDRILIRRETRLLKFNSDVSGAACMHGWCLCASILAAFVNHFLARTVIQSSNNIAPVSTERYRESCTATNSGRREGRRRNFLFIGYPNEITHISRKANVFQQLAANIWHPPPQPLYQAAHGCIKI